ncbi:MAG: GNAT family N-acetyltransferase [Candidatus Tectomicrobia bacterium]|uniref:GNAT family N-acetyltransferase n=1 Tax=Tectimicrobiota bacterium TaxID=2528274 RepID=A0A932HXJ8_UNCTE|nr:GNAT family N-acetyltransferase [Candidatus Tectomicrobia bacterium]
MTGDPGAPRLLEGGKVFLRALTRADIPVWHAWFNSAEVTEHLNKGAFPVTEEAQADYLAHLSKSRADVQLGIGAKEGGQLIGVIGIHKIDWVHRHGDISIVIGDSRWWGKGAATEAIGLMVRHGFEKLNLHKLTAGMWATNEGSRRGFERNGFVLEGTLRQSYFHKTGYVDEWRLGLLRAEWEAKGGGRAS